METIAPTGEKEGCTASHTELNSCPYLLPSVLYFREVSPARNLGVTPLLPQTPNPIILVSIAAYLLTPQASPLLTD